MSYGVAGRTNEFGIRMALGAERRNVLLVVVREALWLAGAGAAVGLALTLGAGRLVESFLYGTKPDDPLILGVSTAAMIATALLAAYLPARRATRIDPSRALRHE
jgi:ABC-type antimicrobial peptide transport system permease subunit